MKFAKKLKIAFIAGCSVLCISSFAFAQTPAQTDNATAQTTQTQETTVPHSATNVNEVFNKLTVQMVQEQKMTQQEADALTTYLHNAEAEYNQMSDEQKAEFIKEHKAMTPEERVAQISVKTGIDADRLVQIFADMKAIVEANAQQNA